MDNQQSGLRFDIYERVHLPEESAGIRELSNLELVPMIRMIREGEQAVLAGNLVLSGNYQGDGEARDEQNLEHLIPVEITLPINRIRNFDQISVDIDNFDIELLSSRVLNVTGVLSLKGVEVLPPDREQENDDGEVVFVHQVADEEEQVSLSADYRSEQVGGNRAEAEQIAEGAAQLAQTLEKAVQSEDVRSEAAQNTGAAEIDDQSQTADSVADSEINSSAAPLSVETQGYGDIEEQTEAQQVKVAFNEKREKEQEHPSPLQLKTLLFKEQEQSLTAKDETENAVITIVQTKNAEKSTQASEQPREEENITAEDGNERDALEWKKLFLQPSNESTQFTRLRICIVQKEETVETIANKYDVTPQKIRSINRLGDQDLAEGQLIYIP